MQLEQLRRKAATVGKLIGKTLSIGIMRRCYRVEDQTVGEDALFGPAYLPAMELWNRLDYAETVLRKAGHKEPKPPTEWTAEEILRQEG